MSEMAEDYPSDTGDDRFSAGGKLAGMQAVTRHRMSAFVFGQHAFNRSYLHGGLQGGERALGSRVAATAVLIVAAYTPPKCFTTCLISGSSSALKLSAEVLVVSSSQGDHDLPSLV